MKRFVGMENITEDIIEKLKLGKHDRHSISFGYGLHSRQERLTTYFIQIKDDIKNINRKLDFIKTHQFIWSYKLKVSDVKVFRLEPYFHYLYDIPMISNTTYSSLNGLSFLINVPLKNEGIGINKGVDLSFERYLMNGYYYLISGSLFDCNSYGYFQGKKTF